MDQGIIGYDAAIQEEVGVLADVQRAKYWTYITPLSNEMCP